MLDWKKIIIIFGCIFHEFKEIQGSDVNKEIIDEWQADYRSWAEYKDVYPDILKGPNNELLRVLNFEVEDKYFIHIDQVDPRVSNKTCRIPAESNPHIRAMYLGNGKIIAKSNQKIFIINVTDCTFKSLDYQIAISRIIPYNFTFDVLSENQYDMVTIHRYSDTGILQETFNNVGFEIWNSDILAPFRDYSPYEKYFRIRRFSEESHTISVINSTFQIESAYRFKNAIEAYSNAHKNFSFCNLSKCQLLDWNFKIHANVSVSIYVPEYYNHQSINMHNLRGGGALVVYQLPFSIKYVHIDASGNHGDIKELYSEYNKPQYDIHIFEKDPLEKIYCVIMQGFNYLKGKCIKI